MNSSDNKNFEKYNDIVDGVKKSINNEENNLLDSISQMDGYEEFIDNLSSEERFKAAVEEMSNAVNNINTEKLINSIRAAERKRRTLRHRIVITSLSFASAIIAICIIVYKPNTADIYKTDSETAVENRKPILIIGDSVVVVSKNNNKIIATDYIARNNNNETEKVVQQKLIIPSGQTYTVVLEDGSEVKLNACSELSYPSSFRGNTREVILKGEAYFEVTKSNKPFIVNVDKSYIKVYGTSFNVDAKSENELKTVLVEGKVGVGSDGIKEIIITPNQLATINLRTKTSNIKNIDVNDYLGWKSDYFKCIDNDISNLINDISLWYDVEFIYDKKTVDNFKVNVSISRNLPMNEVLKYIEDITELKFTKKQNNIYEIEN